MKRSIFKEIEDLIPPKTEWSKLKKTDPYTYAITNERQKLFYFGANHSHDPENHQYPELEKFWNTFVLNDATKRIVLVEGGLRKVAEDLESAIVSDGESGYVTYKAAELDIEIDCPEPKESDERMFLEKQFSKDEIQFYYCARLVPVWHRKGQGATFETFYQKFYGTRFLEVVEKRLPEWQNYDFSLQHMQQIQNKLFGEPFNEENLDFYKKIINPTKAEYRTNLVSGSCSRFRDVYVVKNIIDHWKKGKSMFVTFGVSHAIFQEQALRIFLVEVT